MSNKSHGTVKWFNTEKGYGFLLNEAGEDVFVHYRAIMAEGFKNLRDGQQVEFIQTRSEKGWQAAEVVPAEFEYANPPVSGAGPSVSDSKL